MPFIHIFQMSLNKNKFTLRGKKVESLNVREQNEIFQHQSMIECQRLVYDISFNCKELVHLLLTFKYLSAQT